MRLQQKQLRGLDMIKTRIKLDQPGGGFSDAPFPFSADSKTEVRTSAPLKKSCKRRNPSVWSHAGRLLLYSSSEMFVFHDVLCFTQKRSSGSRDAHHDVTEQNPEAVDHCPPPKGPVWEICLFHSNCCRCSFKVFCSFKKKEKNDPRCFSAAACQHESQSSGAEKGSSLCPIWPTWCSWGDEGKTRLQEPSRRPWGGWRDFWAAVTIWRSLSRIWFLGARRLQSFPKSDRLEAVGLCRNSANRDIDCN